MMEKGADIKISIDRGGTFCDVIAQIAGQDDIVFKLLSVDPQRYRDAPTEAIRRILETVENRKIIRGEPLNASRVASCRIGTTIATNALLENKGQRFALITSRGFKDVCHIGDQTRPDLFSLEVKRAKALHEKVVEVDARITIEDYDLNPSPMDKSSHLTDSRLFRTPSGEVIRILNDVDVEKTRTQLRQLREENYDSVAISLMHSYLYPDHEDKIATLAREEGFKYVTTSHDTAPVIKLIKRSASVSSEAYLYPNVRNYVNDFEAGFQVLPKRVDFMCSDGGLRSAQKFKGNEALLSGPAGGVVGIAQTCYDEAQGTAIIGFDMGGTSTDVSRFDGKYDHLEETTIAGRTIAVPMLNITTVAAGGGSILHARNGLFVVGPESAGAHPGPACYRKGGPLTVTDANLFLGRLVLGSFPPIFGENSDQPLDPSIVERRFKELTSEFNAKSGQDFTPEEVALGFLQVANATMSRPIRNATEAHGFAPDKHNLVSFGGAGGQHACAIADNLGIRRILIHKYSSLLSALGISRATLQHESVAPYSGFFSKQALVSMKAIIHALKEKVRRELLLQGAKEETISLKESLSLQYFGTDTNIVIPKPEDDDYAAAFISTHRREFSFVLARKIVVESIKVRGTAHSDVTAVEGSPFTELKQVKALNIQANSTATQETYIDGHWASTPVYALSNVAKGTKIDGPALLIDQTQTIFVEPRYKAFLLSNHIVLEKEHIPVVRQTIPADVVNPIQLSVFAHRLMSIAEQMGNTLQRTSISSSIKERLDFSCAVFSPEGKLVANAPHIPIHLGSMQMAIQWQHNHWLGKLRPGDVLLTNHPETGGTHLPDLTVVTPVFIGNQIAFYVASRGHHTDIGGKGITSMMPDSKELWEEGLSIKSMKIVTEGVFLEDDVREAFQRAGSFPGCSPTRRLQDNISDLKAQTSSNQRGIILLNKLCEEFTLPVVQTYMRAIQDNAELAVREYFKKVAKEHPGPLEAVDYFDDGTPLHVKITIDPQTGSALYDFTGTGPQVWGNFNCPISITHSAVIYTIRCLIDVDIPLNEGCLVPILIEVPQGTILRPTNSVGICGSTVASQRVIDVILRAFGRVAAFQGCANSLGWGMGGRDPDTGDIIPGWNYGESIGGGTGAGPTWHGQSVSQCHSTNTKTTDPEVIEKRTPVIVRKYLINHGTGGRGRFFGGDGCTREIEARVPLKFSILSDRRVYRPYGMAGGEAGHKGVNYVLRWNTAKTSLVKINCGGKAVCILHPGERIQINTPGGGGWGKPDDDIKPSVANLDTGFSLLDKELAAAAKRDSLPA